MNSINNLPYDQFKALGLDKKDVLSLPSLTLEALLSGKRSQLMSFNHIQLGNGLSLSNLTGRLGLEKQADGNYNLKLFTRQPVTPLEIEGSELTRQQIQLLKSSENPILLMKAKDKAGFVKELLVQYDKRLNDFGLRPLDAGPHQINGHQLSERLKSDFALGKTVKTPDGEIKKDLNSLLGHKATFLVLGAAAATPTAAVNAVAASILAMKQLVKTLSPVASRPYRSYDDSGMIKGYIVLATDVISDLRKPQKAQQVTQNLAETLAKLDSELKELHDQYGVATGDGFSDDPF